MILSKKALIGVIVVLFCLLAVTTYQNVFIAQIMNDKIVSLLEKPLCILQTN